MAADKDALTILAVGDISFRRDNPEEQFAAARADLQAGDVTLGQLESPLSNSGPGQLFTGLGASGRPAPVQTDPDALAKVLVNDGFDALNFAGNHTLDRSEQSMSETIDAARAAGLGIFGAGRSIEEAREPLIIMRGDTKIGFLGYCSVTPRGYEATPNRAGVAPLRASTYYEQVDWQAGTPPRIISRTNADDLAAMVAGIERLRPLVDVLVVPCHGGIHFEPAAIAMYQYEASHAAIDAGADAVLWSHGAVLKGCELYKGKPIMYCIGNFSLVPKGPSGEFLSETSTFDSCFTAITKLTVVDKEIAKVSLLPYWIDTRLEPEPIPASDPRHERFASFMEWSNKTAALPQGTWEVHYLRRPPEAKALLDVGFERDGDEVVVTAR